MEIKDVTEEDKLWVEVLFEKNKDILGPFGVAWFRYWQNENPREKWVVIDRLAFAHYLIKKNGEATLYEIAVAKKRMGLGRLLLKHIGFPMELKTDKTNGESNLFYRKSGFVCLGSKKSKSGKKEFNVYKRWS